MVMLRRAALHPYGEAVPQLLQVVIPPPQLGCLQAIHRLKMALALEKVIAIVPVELVVVDYSVSKIARLPDFKIYKTAMGVKIACESEWRSMQMASS